MNPLHPVDDDNDNDNDNDDQNNHPSYCPSFSTYSTQTEIATRVITLKDEVEVEVEDEDDEFEFYVSGNTNTSPGLTPVYPVFNRDMIRDTNPVELRKLFYDEDEEEELKTVSPETYCLWTPKTASPSPSRCMKSSSTGSTTTASVSVSVSKTWRLRNLLRRCKSDGKEGLMMLVGGGGGGGGGDTSSQKSGNMKSSTRRGVVSKNEAATTAAAVTVRRKSYLPYKQDLLGLFGSPQTLRRINIPPF